MKILKQFFLTAMLMVMAISCNDNNGDTTSDTASGSGGATGGSSGATGGSGGTDKSTDDAADQPVVGKDLFSKWENVSLDLRLIDGDFDNILNKNSSFYLSQAWLDALNGDGRDTTGLVVGTAYSCYFDVLVSGSQSTGTIAVNFSGIDQPNDNACMEWDNDCTVGDCNIDGDHTYTKTATKLNVDYFGTSDNGSYGILEYE